MMLMLLVPMSMFAQKFGCVDYDAVAQDLPEYAKAQGDLQALAKQYDAAVKYIEDRKLDEWVHKKSIQKAVESYRITPEQKEYLKTLKRKA